MIYNFSKLINIYTFCDTIMNDRKECANLEYIHNNNIIIIGFNNNFYFGDDIVKHGHKHNNTKINQKIKIYSHYIIIFT